MYTTLVMSENVQTSLHGALRSVVAFVYIIVISFVWYKLIMKKYYDKHLSKVRMNLSKILAVILALGLVSAALAVQLPKSLSEATLYGVLVGVVVFGVCNLVSVAYVKGWDWEITIVDTLFGVFVCATASMILYSIFFRHGR